MTDDPLPVEKADSRFAKYPETFPVEGPVQLIVADVDGCLSAGSGALFDHAILDRLAELNDLSRTDPLVPSITLCTGRPEPYVECLMQVIHGYRPAMCEGGTVFFDLPTHSILMHPDFGEKEQDLLSRLRVRVEQELVRPGVQPEPGKISHITLIVSAPLMPEDLYPVAKRIADEFNGAFVVELSRKCVHILFRDIHKGTGIAWLSEKTGIPLDRIAGIGDAVPDLPFLERTGVSFAPANAQAPVMDICDFVSRREDHLAASDMLDTILAHNRACKALSGSAVHGVSKS